MINQIKNQNGLNLTKTLAKIARPINKSGRVRKISVFNGKYKVNRLFVVGKYNGYIRMSDFNIRNILEKMNTNHLRECM